MSSDEVLKRNDQINLLKRWLIFSDNGEFTGCFPYPQCGYDLVQQGLVTEDKKITVAGRACLWLLEKSEDPTKSKVSEVLTLRTGD